jgi:hypothetical protein
LNLAIAISETKKGVFEAQQDIRLMRDFFAEEIREEILELVQQAVEKAREYCPCETGALRSSINSKEGEISETNEILNVGIYACRDDIVKPISGKPTSSYAIDVHDGHLTRSGDFWHGTPFLEMAWDEISAQLDDAVSRAMANLEELGDSGTPSTNKKGDTTD